MQRGDEVIKVTRTRTRTTHTHATVVAVYDYHHAVRIRTTRGQEWIVQQKDLIVKPKSLLTEYTNPQNFFQYE